MISSFKESVLWKALQVFRGNLNIERADVILFIIFCHKYGFINEHSSVETLLEDLRNKFNDESFLFPTNLSNKDCKIRNLAKSCGITLRSYKKMHVIFEDDLFAIGASNIKYIVTLIINFDVTKFETIDFLKIFEDSLEEINSYKRYNEFSTPKSILDVMSSLTDVEQAKTVYNPFAGKASFGITLNNQTYAAQELVQRTWAVGLMRLLVHGKQVINYTNSDSVHDNLFGQNLYDVVLSCPPFSLKLGQDSLYYSQTKTAEEFALLRGYESLKPNGTLAVLVSNGKLSGSALNKYFVDQKAVAAVIHLPAGVLPNNNIATSIIVLKKSAQDKVLFIDASKEFEKGKRSNYLTQANVDKIITYFVNKEAINDYSVLVSNNEIAENDYYLTYSRYAFNAKNFAQSNEIDSNQMLVTLSDLLLNLPLDKAAIGQKGKTIRIKNLSDNVFNANINIDLLEEEVLEKSWQKITSKAILLSKRFNNLKPSIIEAEESNPVFISPDIFAFHIKEDIDYNFLIWQLSSEFVQKQLQSFTTGAVMPSITMKNLLQIVIPIPTLSEQQKSLFLAAKLQADKDKIIQANLQETIDSLVKDRTNEIQWQLHDLRNSELLGLKNKMSLLAKLISRNNTVKDIIIDQEDNLRLEDFTEHLLQQVQNLTVKIGNIFEEADKVGLKEIFDTYEELRKNTFYQEFLNINQIVALEKDPNITTEISFNKSDFNKIINNVFENIKRHGFHNIPPEEQRFEIILSQEDHYLKISILNNGNYIAVTPEDYFANGGRQGKTGNSGKGGYLIKKCMERNGGKVNIYTYDTKDKYDYVFKIELLFKLESNDEL